MPTEIAELGVKVTSKGISSTDKKLDKLGNTTAKTERKTKKFGNTSRRTGGAVESLGLTSKATAIIIGVTLVGAMAKSISLHSAFASKISELSAITGATGKDLKFYSEQAKLIGETTTLSATQAAEAFKLIASAKPDLLDNAEALAAVTKEAVALAEASGLDLPTAADALGSALNQFGEGADQASRFINVLAAGSKFGASAINDVAMSMRAAGTVAANAGISFEETTAAIETLGKVAIKGAEAGTDLRNIILRLSTQSRDEFNPEIVGLTQAFINLKEANLNTAESQKLFGTRSIAAANALVKQSDNIVELTRKLTDTNTAYEQAATRTDNLEGDTKALGSAWEGVGIELGSVFNPSLRLATKLLTGFAKATKSMVVAFDDMIDGIGAYAAAISSLISLDLNGAKAILDARTEERASNQQRINDIWSTVTAQKALNKENENASSSINEDKGPEKLNVKKGLKITGDEDEFIETKIERLKEQFATERELEISAFQETNAILNELKLESFEDELGLETEIREIQRRAKEQHEKALTAIAKKEGKERSEWEKKYAREQASTAIGNAASLFGALASLSGKHNKKLLQAQRALSLVQIAMNLPPSIMKAYATLGPIGGTVATVGLVATAAAQVSAVNSAASGGGGGGGSVSAPPSVPTPPDTVGIPSGGQPFQQPQQGVNLTLNIEGSVVAEDLEGIIADGVRKGMDKDLINLTIIGDRVEMA